MDPHARIAGTADGASHTCMCRPHLPDLQAMILEMAAANEIDQALMDLLTQNIEAAKAAEQVSTIQGMTFIDQEYSCATCVRNLIKRWHWGGQVCAVVSQAIADRSTALNVARCRISDSVYVCGCMPSSWGRPHAQPHASVSVSIPRVT